MHLLSANLEAIRLNCVRTFTLFLSERQSGEAWKPSKKQILFRILGGGGGAAGSTGKKRTLIPLVFKSSNNLYTVSMHEDSSTTKDALPVSVYSS